MFDCLATPQTSLEWWHLVYHRSHCKDPFKQTMLDKPYKLQITNFACQTKCFSIWPPQTMCFINILTYDWQNAFEQFQSQAAGAHRFGHFKIIIL